MMTADELARTILAVPDIAGLTLTGGEPTVQSGGLLPVLTRVRQAGLSVMLYSGYELPELRRPSERALLRLTDIAVVGRYVAAQRDLTQPWRGSRNQKVLFLSDRYGPADLDTAAGRLEFHLYDSGDAVLTGFPEETWFEDAR
jgi:anaerobic ribonucleoside-triphosphate reductase activating protein